MKIFIVIPEMCGLQELCWMCCQTEFSYVDLEQEMMCSSKIWKIYITINCWNETCYNLNICIDVVIKIVIVEIMEVFLVNMIILVGFFKTIK